MSGLEEQLRSLIDSLSLSQDQQDALLLSARVIDETLSVAPLDADHQALIADLARPVGDGRYVEQVLLGRGGQGVVHRVFDRQLRRTLVRKVLRADRWPEQTRRFLAEAEVIAHLQHPGVVPIYDIGNLPDGRPYYTMPEIRGQTLAERIEQEDDGPQRLQTLLVVLARVAQTTAYAHSRGIAHRDLKPGNIMIGPFGEVLVLDWGTAQVSTAAPLLQANALQTRAGAVMGTPAYMAPEQARGAAVGPPADVYALGGMLYEILVGRRVRQGDVDAVMAQAEVGALPDFPDGLPAPLVETCRGALQIEPGHRITAARLAERLRDWLTGAQRRAAGLAVLADADALLPQIADHRTRAAALLAEAEALLAGIPAHAPASMKHTGWQRQDAAAVLHSEAARLQLEVLRLTRSALTHDPALPEAHARLAAHHRQEQAAAEAARDSAAASRAAHLLAVHDRGEHAAWRQGDGAVSLVTDPPGARVLLERFVLRDRRLVAEPAGDLGLTPLSAVTLPRGSYRLILRHPDRPPVRYPVHIARQHHWDGRDPDGVVQPIRLPAEIPAGCSHVPAGWFSSGGDPEFEQPGRRVWVPGFFIQQLPVTNAAYVAFLDDLVATGREEEALAAVPRERAARPGEHGAMLYGRRPDGRFFLQVDAQGHRWDPDYPVLNVNWFGAWAYGQWHAEKTGQPWRLPYELEWEKAARGVDGRFYPWGDAFDPSWCCMRDSHRGPRLPQVVGAFAGDVGPYGVRDMAGGAWDWCADIFQPVAPRIESGRMVAAEITPADGVQRSHRGGNWTGTGRFARCARRSRFPATTRNAFHSFRLVCPLD